METGKACSGCHTEKPLTEFWRKASAADGRQTLCKPCQTARNAAWDQANPERRLAGKRAQAFRAKYGITHDERDGMLAAQGHVCAVCGTDTPGGRWGRWHLDHDHATGQPRGVLCNDCNAGLGIFRDDIERLRAAIHYLGGAA